MDSDTEDGMGAATIETHKNIPLSARSIQDTTTHKAITHLLLSLLCILSFYVQSHTLHLYILTILFGFSLLNSKKVLAFYIGLFTFLLGLKMYVVGDVLFLHEISMQDSIFLFLLFVVITYVGVSYIITKITLTKYVKILNLIDFIARSGDGQPPSSQVIKFALNAVCEIKDWSIGHAYIFHPETGELVSSGLWYLDSEDKFKAFKEVTEKTRLKSGEGLSGTVLATGEAFYLKNLSEEKNTDRAKTLAGVGVYGALAFPIFVEGKCVAVVEFFAPKLQKIDQDILRFSSGIGMQIAKSIAHEFTVQRIGLEQQRRRKLETLSEAIVKTTRDGLVSMDKQGIIKSFNPAAETIFGYTEAEAISKNITTLIHTSPDNKNDDSLQHYLQSGVQDAGLCKDDKMLDSLIRYKEKYHKQTVGLCKDNSTFPMDISISETHYKKNITYIASIRDITERKNSEDRLAHQKKYYENIITNFTFPVYGINIARKVVIWNKACEILTGIKAEDMIGTDEYWRGLYPSKRICIVDIILQSHSLMHLENHDGNSTQRTDLILDRYFKEMDELYDTFAPHPFLPYGVKASNWVTIPATGKELYLNIDASPIYDDDGNVITAISVIDDITSQKQTMIDLNNRTAELERSNRDLEEFAYVASHDLQEPLRMVSGYTQLLASRYKGKLDSNADEFIEYAVDGAKRMRILINELLKFSRLNRQEYTFVSIDMNQLYHDVIDSLAVLISNSGVVITKDDLPVVSGDTPMLTLLLQNLFGNAIKYRSPEREGKVHISAQLIEEDNMWRFCVEDNGIGIQSEFYDKIFIIFKRLHRAHEYKGTGIGLATCKKIVDAHKGNIWVESEYGKKTCFYFTLPK